MVESGTVEKEAKSGVCYHSLAVLKKEPRRNSGSTVPKTTDFPARWPSEICKRVRLGSLFNRFCSRFEWSLPG